MKNCPPQFRSVSSFVTLSLIGLFFVGGCDSRPSRVPVSGKVLIDGEPLTYGAVVFSPEGGRQSSGIIDNAGHFTLTCFEPGDGALVGKHRIQVLACDSVNPTTTKWYAPKKYADRRSSELVQEIKGPTDSVEINLTWKGNTPDKPFIEHSDSTGDDAFAKSRRKKSEQ
jgi:hypothetical protein